MANLFDTLHPSQAQSFPFISTVIQIAAIRVRQSLYQSTSEYSFLHLLSHRYTSGMVHRPSHFMEVTPEDPIVSEWAVHSHDKTRQNIAKWPKNYMHNSSMMRRWWYLVYLETWIFCFRCYEQTKNHKNARTWHIDVYIYSYILVSSISVWLMSIEIACLDFSEQIKHYQASTCFFNIEFIIGYTPLISSCVV